MLAAGPEHVSSPLALLRENSLLPSSGSDHVENISQSAQLENSSRSVQLDNDSPVARMHDKDPR